MENNEENLGSQEPVVETTTNSSPVKAGNTKLIGIIAVAIVVILAIFFMFFTRSAKSTVKDYIKAFSKANAGKVIALMDFEGVTAFETTQRDLSKFDETYEEVLKEIKDLDKDQKEQYKEAKDTAKETMQATLDMFKEAKIKYSVSNIKTEKVDGSKKLTKVTCTIKAKAEDEEIERDVTFYTVKKGLKNYLVSSGM